MPPQHMKNPTPFRIRVSIKHVFIVFIIETDHVYLLFLGFCQIALKGDDVMHICLIFSFLMLRP